MILERARPAFHTSVGVRRPPGDQASGLVVGRHGDRGNRPSGAPHSCRRAGSGRSPRARDRPAAAIPEPPRSPSAAPRARRGLRPARRDARGRGLRAASWRSPWSGRTARWRPPRPPGRAAWSAARRRGRPRRLVPEAGCAGHRPPPPGPRRRRTRRRRGPGRAPPRRSPRRRSRGPRPPTRAGRARPPRRRAARCAVAARTRPAPPPAGARRTPPSRAGSPAARRPRAGPPAPRARHRTSPLRRAARPPPRRRRTRPRGAAEPGGRARQQTGARSASSLASSRRRTANTNQRIAQYMKIPSQAPAATRATW